jgi:hypothetical protein
MALKENLQHRKQKPHDAFCMVEPYWNIQHEGGYDIQCVSKIFVVEQQECYRLYFLRLWKHIIVIE